MEMETGLKLSPRLEKVAGFVLPGEPAADIGSDHAYLPIYLVRNGIVPSAVAVEVHPSPWQSSLDQVHLHQLEDKIQVRLGDGFAPLAPGEVATAVVAGMGARTIIHILSHGQAILPTLKRLVLQPMAGVAELRQWLYDRGFCLVDEELVQEGEQFYFILAAEKGETKPLSPWEREFGPILLAKRHPLLVPYLERLIRQQERILLSLQRGVSAKAGKERRAAEGRLNLLREVMKWLSTAND